MDQYELPMNDSFTLYFMKILDDPRSKRDFRGPNALGTHVLRRFKDDLSSEQLAALDLSEFGDRHRRYVRRSKEIIKKIWKIDDKRRRSGASFEKYDALNRIAIYAIGDNDVLDLRFVAFFSEISETLEISLVELEGMFRDCLFYFD